MPVTNVLCQEGELVFDDRYAPIFTTNNIGKWDPSGLREWYALSRAAIHKSVDAGHKAFFIGDISKAASPDAVMRKVIAELQEEFDAPFRGTETWIGQCYVISNVVMRGIVTAVQWMMPGGSPAPMTTAPNMTGALKIAEQAYAKYGLQMPDFPRDYEFPPFSKSW